MRDLGGLGGDVDDLRARRDARKNPPSYEAGQGADDEWNFFDEGGAGMDEKDGLSDSVWGGTAYDQQQTSPNALGAGFGGLGGFPPQQQQQQPKKDYMDMTWDATVSTLKVAKEKGTILTKGILSIFTEWNYRKCVRFGVKYMQLSAVVIGFGCIWSLLGVFSTFFNNGYYVLIGGLLMLGIGIVMSLFFADKAVEEERLAGEYEEVIEETPVESNYVVEEDEEVDPFANWGDSEEEEEEVSEPIDWGLDSWAEEESEAEDTLDDLVFESDLNITSAIDNIADIPPHTQTRAYLVEQITKVLPTITPTFADMKIIDEDETNFVVIEELLNKSSLQVGLSEEPGKYPELLELRENSFIIQLKATRPSGLSSAKEIAIASEIANIYSHDEYGKEIYTGVYATVNSVGENFIINLFKGENVMVSLGDAYRKVKDKLADPKCRMPMVWGVSELGEVWFSDIYKDESFILSGMPRSGKSWKAQSMLLQMCMFNSPEDINFYAFDTKGTISDYNAMSKYLPHFKGFESNPKAIMTRIKQIINVEGPRREKLIASTGCLNISDLKETHPEIDLPFIYVIIDEMVSLNKELSDLGPTYIKEFQAYLNDMVTKMPGFGIRTILIPHRIVNDIISKTTYSLVPNKSCIGASFDDIKNSLEISNQKLFPYSLVKQGDMAIKAKGIASGRVVYGHGEVLTSTNDGNIELFKYVGALWNKLEPPTVVEEEPFKKQFAGHSAMVEEDTVKYQGVSSIDDAEDDFWNDVLKKD